MNRFSRDISPSYIGNSYIPLPLDLISKKLDQRQQKHDAVKASFGAMEEAVLGVQGLGADAENLKAKQAEYNDEILKGIEEVGGDYYRLGGLSEVMGRKLKQDLTVGQLAGIRSNYSQAMEHKKELDEKLAKNDISPEGYALGLKSISNFSGTVEDGQGGYSRINLYTPTSYVNIPKQAQDYAAKSEDQYTANGEQFLDATAVKNNTYNMMIRDSGVVSNAREKVMADPDNSNLSTSDIEKKTFEYIEKIAGNAGYERAYFKPTKDTLGAGGTGTKSSANSSTETWTMIGANPKTSGFTGKIEEIKESARVKIFDDLSIGSILSGEAKALGKHEGFEKDQPLERIKSAILADDSVKDRLIREGYNPDKITKKEFEEFSEKVQNIDASARSTKFSTLTPQEYDNFEFMVTKQPLNFLNSIVVTADGRRLTQKEKETIINAHSSGKAEDPKMMPSGIVNPGEKPQPFPKGSIAFGSNALPDVDNGKGYIILPKETNTADALVDRVLYAADENSGGYSEWYNGEKTSIFQPVVSPDGTDKKVIREYTKNKDGSVKGTDNYYSIGADGKSVSVLGKKSSEDIKQENNYNLGLKNNNPLNIRNRSDIDWRGETSKGNQSFESFESPEMGFRAAAKNIISHINRGDNTVEKLISKWAPFHENDTAKYIEVVSRLTGLPATAKVTTENLPLVLRAMAIMETGKDFGSDIITTAISKI